MLNLTNDTPCDCGKNCGLTYTRIGNLFVSTNGRTVSGETADGFEILAKSAPAVGKRAMLGVEDYAYSCARRLSCKRHTGPFSGSTPRAPTTDELTYMRAAVRAHLAAIDRGEVTV